MSSPRAAAQAGPFRAPEIARWLLAGALVASAAGCARPAPHFSEPNARAHVVHLAGTIGSRPAGSDANRRAREYVVDQLRFYGFSVRVQEADASRPEFGLTGRVANVIAILPGARPEAIGLVAHYDSVPTGPGAADDGLGVAVVLEAARLLASDRARQHTVMALITDAEENGLLGAAAAVRDPEVQSRLRAYINVEAVGSDTPAVLFQAGPANGWLARTWMRAVPHPRGGSYMEEVYARLPNDTDFSIFARAGWPGLNLAATGDSYAYHTPRDTPERLTARVLEQVGRNVVAAARALDRTDITARTAERPRYFDVAGRTAFTIAPAAGTALTIVAIVLGVLGWWRAARAVVAAGGMAGLLRTIAWAVISVALVAGALVGTMALLRAVREVYHPWYAHPARSWALLVLIGVLVVELLLRLGEHLPGWLRAVRHPASVWLVTLPAWMALTIAAERLAPQASYLWGLPLAVAALAVALLPAARGIAGRVVAVVALAAAAALWLQDGREILAFAVPTLGRFPFVTPIVVLPALLLAVGIVLGPPLVAIAVAAPVPPREAALTLGGRRVRALLLPTLFLVVTAAFASAYLADAYTPERPLWRSAVYVADHASGRAAWEVGSIEPGLDLALDAAAPRGWTPSGRGPLLDGVPAPRLAHPFRFRAPGRLEPAPVTAVLRTTGAAATASIEVVVATAVPGLTVAFALPPGLAPARSSLPGMVREGWWTAAYAAAPAGTVTFSAALPAGAEARLADLRVIAIAAGLPGGSGWLRQPRWLDGTRAAWSARSVHVVAPSVEPPVPPLR